MDYPYMISNNKISQILEKIETAEKPPRFTHEFLKKLGFNSSNDRAIIPLLKKLEFLNENGAPTEYYDYLRDHNKQKSVLADRVRELYSDLFSINTKIYRDNDDEIKGAISRITGKDAKAVNRIFATFKALTELADFDSSYKKQAKEGKDYSKKSEDSKADSEKSNLQHAPNFRYNIEIHLPATTDISVYNAIFKSLKDNLLI